MCEQVNLQMVIKNGRSKKSKSLRAIPNIKKVHDKKKLEQVLYKLKKFASYMTWIITIKKVFLKDEKQGLS